MNGIKYIREKSNFTKNALAKRMGVTRQTITMWEQGVRKPDKDHLKWLCDFYGIEGKWFGELSEGDLVALNEMKMYSHREGNKEYYTFVPKLDGWAEPSICCGDLEEMSDDTYAETIKKKKVFIQRVEQYLESDRRETASLFDKNLIAKRGMNDIERFLDLMDMLQNVGSEGIFLKIPFRYEIITVIYAMMVASGFCSIEEIKEKYANDFESEYGIKIDVEYLNRLIELTSKHWSVRKNEEIKRVAYFDNRLN